MRLSRRFGRRELAILHPAPGAKPAPVVSSCPPAKHLYIAVPALTGEVKLQTTASLVGAAVALALCGIEVTFAGQPGCTYLDHVRNRLVTGFIRSNATDLLFWDADVGAPAEAVIMLAKADRPYICAVYPEKSDAAAFPVRFDTDEIWSDADGLVMPASVPTGFTRINRAVFEAMPCIPYQDDEGHDWLGYFQSGIRGGKYGGEDTAFAATWRGMGGKIHMIPDVTMTHTGPKTWEGNWAQWMRKRVEGETAHKCGRIYPTTCVFNECRDSGLCRDEQAAEAAE